MWRIEITEKESSGNALIEKAKQGEVTANKTYPDREARGSSSVWQAPACTLYMHFPATVEMKKDIDFSKKLSPIPKKDESLVGNVSFNVLFHAPQ